VQPEIWEQYEWATLPPDQEELVVDYIATACRILDNVGLSPQGVTSPGGFGGQSLDYYARVVGLAVGQVTGNPTPYFFQRIHADGPVATPVWHMDRARGTAVGEIIAGTHDWTGSWTGYGEVSADYYITADLQGGRLPGLIDAGDPAILCSHWQGFYGLHNDDRRGFRTLQTVVQRLKERDPLSERTQWRKCSEIARYACAREMAEVRTSDQAIRLDLPLQAPALTLQLRDVEVDAVSVDGTPLTRGSSRAAFGIGTFFSEGDVTWVAFDPRQRQTTVEVKAHS
jgi:hypothetical protein